MSTQSTRSRVVCVGLSGRIEYRHILGVCIGDRYIRDLSTEVNVSQSHLKPDNVRYVLVSENYLI